ncbi:MAG: DALR anticodon-binding domain-containing protein, partial [Mariprofundaceae bacterium]|nr:DALR anticodon-binding domain-containing protein [Mariprofundaceae bacterium]
MNDFSFERRHLDAALHASVDRPAYQCIAVAGLLAGFSDSETGQAVAAANKRIANILKKSAAVTAPVNPSLFAGDAESGLFAALEAAESAMPEDASGMLTSLAGLREAVDRFFDDVMVMAEDEAVRVNRLALLTRLRGLFLKLADISRL